MFHLGACGIKTTQGINCALSRTVVDCCWQTGDRRRASNHRNERTLFDRCNSPSKVPSKVLADKQPSRHSPRPSRVQFFNRRQLARRKLRGFCSPGRNRIGRLSNRWVCVVYGDIFRNCFASVFSLMGRHDYMFADSTWLCLFCFVCTRDKLEFNLLLKLVVVESSINPDARSSDIYIECSKI